MGMCVPRLRGGRHEEKMTMQRAFLNRCCWAFAAVACIAGAARAEDPAPADAKFFEAKVYPIFQSRCVSCHGPEKQKGELRLDTAEGINKGGENGPLLVAKASADSTLFKLITKPKGDPDIMPAKGDPLTADEIAIIKSWIDAGGSLGEFKGGAPASQNANAAAADSGVKMAAPGEVKPYDGGVLAELAKNVQPATPETVKALTDAGALALNIDRQSPLLSVNFKLAGPQVTDEKLASLAQAAPNVAWLDLANTKVTDAGLAALDGLPNVTVLHLERTGVTDAAIDHVAKLQHLEYLNLYGTGVSDAGLAKLEGSKSLKKLYVWQSKVTPEGVEKIKAANPNLYVNNGIEEAKAAPAACPAGCVDISKLDLSLLFDADSCCAKAKAAGKDCDHPCCAEAKKAGKVCEKCNANGAKKLEALKKADPDSCCGKALAEGKLCDHDCCKAALEKGEVCMKCNPKACAAAAGKPADGVPAVTTPAACVDVSKLDLALLADTDSCCAKAKAAGKDCDHPCCVEAKKAGKLCDKCNPNAAKKLEALKKADPDSCCGKAICAGKLCDHDCCKAALEKGEVCMKCNPKACAAAAKTAEGDKKDLSLLFDKDSCCAKAKAEGKECDHPCCVEARKAGKVCEKCNPGSAQKNVALVFDKDSCCDKAKQAGKDCDHPCCVEAAKKGEVCKKCNPKAA